MGMDNRTRAFVHYLSKIEGLFIRQIAKKCNVPRATVWRISKMDLARDKGLLKKIDLKGRGFLHKNEYPRHVWNHDIAFYLDGTASLGPSFST